jgi:hypothetical protein
MKQFCAAISIFLIFFGNVSAQLKIQGQTINAANSQPIAYVNIGIPGVGVGTVSDEAGNFDLAIAEKHIDDSLLFSSLGYAQQYIAIKKLITPGQVVGMNEVIEVLDEVAVEASRLEQKVLGNEVRSKIFKGGFGSKWLGAEVGTIIKTKGRPTLLEEFRFNIVENTFDSISFRLNIYSIEADIPNRKLLSSNLIVTTDLKEGQEVVDLRSLHLVLEEDFVISLEWIAKYGNQDPGVVLFPFGLFKSKSYFRKTSHSTWETNNKLGVGFHVLVSQ